MSSFAEDWMEALLDRMGLSYTPQQKFAGHAIDFVVDAEWGPLLLDVNGDRWHSWKKIVDCDRVKLTRVLDAGGCPLGVWWSRCVASEAQVREGIMVALTRPCLPWWDWSVERKSLGSQQARERSEALLIPGHDSLWPLRRAKGTGRTVRPISG